METEAIGHHHARPLQLWHQSMAAPHTSLIGMRSSSLLRAYWTNGQGQFTCVIRFP